MTFRAKYDGHCAECGEEIVEGNLLEHVETDRGMRVVHSETCADRVEDKQARASKRETCPACWQLLAHNGSCGCDPE